MIAIRGATTISNNTSEEIMAASIELFEQIQLANNIDINKIVSIFFSCTRDITADYPGKHVREHFNLNNVSFMHFNEMYVENSLPLCIRILVQVEGTKNLNTRYVYLKEAKNLRIDLFPLEF